jgi:thioredoxin-dependent peroxiredoxin
MIFEIALPQNRIRKIQTTNVSPAPLPKNTPCDTPMLKAGDIAPDFSLPDAMMEPVSLAEFRGRNVVIYFFARVATPGCAALVEEISDHQDDFEAEETAVLGITPEECLQLEAFSDEHGLSLPLLSDADCEVCASFGVLKDAAPAGSGNTSNGNGHHRAITRSTFVIDKAGVVRHVLIDAKARGHTSEVLKLVRMIN